MNAFLKKTFLSEPKMLGAGYRYGFLALILALIIIHAFDPPHHYWSGFLLPTMLLFNHLAFQFRWSRTVTVALRICAWFWIGFGLMVFSYDIIRRL